MDQKVSPLGTGKNYPSILRSTIIHTPGTAIRTHRFFPSAGGYNEFYQSHQLPFSQDLEVTLRAVGFFCGLKFATPTGTTGKTKEAFQSLWQHGLLRFGLENAAMSEYPLHLVGTFDYNQLDGTLTVRTKFSDLVPLAEPVTIPSGVRFVVECKLPDGYTLDATGTEYLPDAPSAFTLTNNMGFFTSFKAAAVIHEPVR